MPLEDGETPLKDGEVPLEDGEEDVLRSESRFECEDVCEDVWGAASWEKKIIHASPASSILPTTHRMSQGENEDFIETELLITLPFVFLRSEVAPRPTFVRLVPSMRRQPAAVAN